ncbi:MAG TPA: ATP-binding protein, partial [Methylophilus sp.]
LKLILDNLISNAVKYTGNDGTIAIASKSDKEWHTISVKDNGPGLSPQDTAQLFDPFYQGNTLHQGLVSSSGLGLHIAKQLAESLQGGIDLITAEVGAHFVLRLPTLELP